MLCLVQAISDYQSLQRLNGPVGNSKKTKQFSKPTVEEIEGNFYLIADDVFLLGEPSSKLDSDQLKDLPFNISWSGPKLNFKIDPRECYRLLLEVISDMNKMQKDKKYLGFPVGMKSSRN